MVRRLLNKFRARGSDQTAEPPYELSLGRIPDGERLYAIGDIHGRLDLLQELHEAIAAARGSSGAGQRVPIIYLGAYIDRGLENRQVIDLLLSPPDDGARRIFLLGNHEAMLLAFLDSTRGAAAWLRNGGDTTLHSYGAGTFNGPVGENELEAARHALRDRLGEAHRAFFQGLRLCHELGDYYFVHAGVRPGRPLNQQAREDMIWIRKDFLESREDFGKIIVHGHSIRAKVEERSNRIGIDTGAYMSGTLTALVLEGDQRRYLST